MKIEINDCNGISVAEVISEEVEIRNTQDALDLMANCDYQGSRRIIVHKKNINPQFFDLRTGFAGEVLQKFSTYDVRLTIVGDFSEFNSKSLKDFIRESNRTGRIRFVPSVQAAREKMR